MIATVCRVVAAGSVASRASDATPRATKTPDSDARRPSS